MHCFLRKGYSTRGLRNEPASPNFGEQNHLPPPKNIGNKKTDGALQKRNDAVLFCCHRGRGVSSCFVIFGCISSVLVQLPHEVYFTYLPMCGTPCYGKNPIRLTLLSGNLGFPSQESFLPFFMVEWGNYTIFFSKTRILETSHFLLKHDHRKI